MFLIGRFLSSLAKASSLIGTICVILMMLHVTADVIGRYFFNAPLPGTIVVVANYYMIVLVFIAIGVAEEKQAHISVEFVTDMMPKRVQTGFSVFSGVLTVIVITALMIAGYTEAVKKTNIGATMEQGSQMIEVWQSYWAIPVGTGLMVLIAAYRVITTVTGLRSGLNETVMDAELINE
ncbi:MULTISPECIES: TRAP transporter small permease [Roseobacteraceae]|uniref:TRAP transporter small permease protein n=1 Tax=Pseudosulfitobacter pseudonitzschiae TaxID=1402135 RepID=A0A221K5V9_9RHOB|nr:MULTISPECIES: TRAP transporter small permease [Roseobacteraceae]ASM74384.1 tripartite ATP-independent periplasmic transporter, DctQ component [Pseudosulfitobacter pseudonitzschiae]